MIIEVEPGDVVIREVAVREHPEGIHTITISTPRDKAPLVSFRSEACSTPGLWGVTYCVELLNAWADGGALASVIYLRPENEREAAALVSGLDPLDYCNWHVTLIAIPADVFDRGRLVSSWDRPERADVEYLRT